MERKEAIRGAYRMTGGNSFYDGMITCSTLSGKAVCRLVWAMNKAENDAYLELRRRLCGLSVAVTELYRKVAPPTREKWLSTQEVCEALHISQRALQNYRDRGIIPYSTIGSKFYYRETDVERVIREALIRR